MSNGFFNATAGGGMYDGGGYFRRNAFDLSGIPGLNGPAGMVGGMLLQQLLPHVLGPNYMAAPFLPQGQNLQQHQESLRYFAEEARAMQAGSKRDTESRYEMLRGMAAMTGVDFGPKQQAAARQIAKDFGMVSPMLAQMMPEFWDRAHGSKGSAEVMGRYLHAGGRMAFDPETGRMGLSGDSTNRLVEDVSKGLFGEGADRHRVSGLRMGQVGTMFDEMAKRGLGSSIAGKGGLDSKAVIKSLQDMSGAVKAVQEIFGDMGHPDAPMGQVFNALQQLTQGGAGRFSPEKLEQSVRSTYTIAKATKLGMDAMMGLMASLGQSADQLGLDRSFVPEAAQHAALGGHAFGARGDQGGFGRLSKEKFTQLSGQLSVQAANSQQAQQMGVVMALSDQKQVKAGTSAANLAAAIANGETTFDDRGTKRSVFMSPMEMSRIMREGSASQSTIDTLLASPRSLQEFVQKYNIGTMVRENQGAIDIDPMLSRQFGGAAQAALKGKGGPDLAKDIGSAAIRAFRGMDPRTMSDPAARNAALVAALKADPSLKGKLGGVTDAELQNVAIAGWAQTNQYVMDPNSGLAGSGGLLGLMDVTDKKIMSQVRRAQADVAGITAVQTSVAGMGQHGILSRMVDAISKADGKTDVQDIIAQALGGISRGDTTAVIADRYKALSSVGKRLHAATVAARGLSGDALERKQQEIAEFKEQSKAIVGEIDSFIEKSPDRDKIKAMSKADKDDVKGDGGAKGKPTAVTGTLKIEWGGASGIIDMVPVRPGDPIV